MSVEILIGLYLLMIMTGWSALAWVALRDQKKRSNHEKDN